jgi:hypothetical protein
LLLLQCEKRSRFVVVANLDTGTLRIYQSKMPRWGAAACWKHQNTPLFFLDSFDSFDCFGPFVELFLMVVCKTGFVRMELTARAVLRFGVSLSPQASRSPAPCWSRS